MTERHKQFIVVAIYSVDMKHSLDSAEDVTRYLAEKLTQLSRSIDKDGQFIAEAFRHVGEVQTQ